MRRRALNLALVAATLILVTSCGPGDGPTAESRTPTELVDAAPGDAADATAYRATSNSGRITEVEALGLDTVVELDPDGPSIVTEVDATGSAYSTVDLSTTLAALPDASELDATGFETWVVGDLITVDTTGFSAIADADGSASLGVFRPGVWTADPSTIAADRNDVVTAIAGTGLPDPTQLAGTFLDSLDGIEADPDDPTRFTAETDYASLLEVHGQDVETVDRSAAAGIAQLSGILEPLAALYLDNYAGAPVALEIVIIDGTLSSIDATTDLSSIWGRLAEESAALGLDVDDSERAELQASTNDGVLIVQSLTTFEFDDTIEVVAPTDVDEGRTEEVGEFLAQVFGN